MDIQTTPAGTGVILDAFEQGIRNRCNTTTKNSTGKRLQ